MSYATQDDLITRFGRPELVQLTDREDDATGEIDATKVMAALDEATAEVNSYLARIVTTPIDPVPDQVKRITIDLARYRLYRDNVPDQVRTAYTDAIAWLKQAAAGAVSLGNDDGPTVPASGGVVSTSAPSRIFTRDKLKGF